MSDELTQGVAGGQTETTPVPEGEKAQGAAATGGQPDKTPAVDLNALVQSVDGLNKLMGKWSNEVGEVRQGMQAIINRQQEIDQNLRRQEPTRAPGDDIDETEFLTHPKETIKKVLQAEFETRERASREQRMQVEAQEALANYRQGFAAARKENPDLYDGIDKEVTQNLYQAYVNGIINKHDLTNPDTYRQTAQAMRVFRGEYDKVVPTKKSAPLTSTEVPKGRKDVDSDEDEFVLDDDAKEFAKQQGWTDKEAVENINLGVDSRKKSRKASR